MPPLTTSNDIFATLQGALPLMGYLHAPQAEAYVEAVSSASPVDRAVNGMEALYAAVLQDAGLTAATLSSVATGAGQLAYLVLNGQWHGKAQRASDILDAMRKVVEQGVAPADAGGPAVDAKFAPSAAPLAAQGA